MRRGFLASVVCVVVLMTMACAMGRSTLTANEMLAEITLSQNGGCNLTNLAEACTLTMLPTHDGSGDVLVHVSTDWADEEVSLRQGTRSFITFIWNPTTGVVVEKNRK